MQRVETEGVWTELHVPGPGEDPDTLSFLEIDQSRCIGCDSCQKYCPANVIQGASGRPHSMPFKQACIHCGQCLSHCPQGAIYEKQSWLLEVTRRLSDGNTVCVAIPDASVRYALAEMFGFPVGVAAAGKLRAAVSALGFDHCWDGEFAADILIRELSGEFAGRLGSGGVFPLMTSGCAGWQSYCELFFPDLLPFLSTCASAAVMGGMLAKTFGAEQMGYDAGRVYTVAVSPCIAQKYEALRPEFRRQDGRYVDAVLTTREFGYLVKKAGIDYRRLPEAGEDDLMGESTGAATISCVPGGLAEAVLRCAYQDLTEIRPKSLDFMPVRGMEGLRSASINIGGSDVRVAIVHGAKNFPAVLESVRKGECPYHFIEFSACPGGCICGGGQPVFPSVRDVFERTEEVFF